MSIELVMPSNYLILCRPLSSCPQFFPTLGSFPVSRFFPSGGQSIEASAWVLPVNIQGWFPLRNYFIIQILVCIELICKTNFSKNNVNSLHKSVLCKSGLLGVSLAVPGLGCGTWGLPSSLQHVRSLVEMCEFSVASHGIQSGPPALGAWSLSHWASRKVPGFDFKCKVMQQQFDVSCDSFHNL